MTRHMPQYDEAVETLVRVDLAALLVIMGQARDGHPGAQRYDTPHTSGHTSILFCERHEQDACECGQSTVYPSVSDPTGEVAVRLAHHHDQARVDIDAAHQLRRLVLKAARIAERLDISWKPHDASAYQRLTNASSPGCRSCSRLQVQLADGSNVPRWSEVWRDHLCRWCSDWRRRAGGLPPVDKLEAHHAGTRVMVPVVKNGAA